MRIQNFYARITVILVSVIFLFSKVNAQDLKLTEGFGKISGNYQMDAQYYLEDTLIGAPDVPEKMRMNGFLNLIYEKDFIQAGIRYESYQKPLLGFDPGYEGEGIPYRYVTIKLKELEFTAGNFYEQFGSGMIFRAYEERLLGYDNVMDGFRVKYSPIKGVNLKGVWGRQRLFFDKGPGIVRGADGEFILNELMPNMKDSKHKIALGASVVSKYQSDEDPFLKLPENVSAFGGRMNYHLKNFNFYAEGAYKINDPSSVNNQNYNPGNGLYAVASYARKGFGMNVSFKRIDNMDFRSDRNQSVNNLLINYLPAISKQQTYRIYTLYPYGTQNNGETGMQADVLYKIKKKTALGGKYGVNIAANFSLIYGLDTTMNDEYTYQAEFFSLKPENKYFHDFNLEVSKKFSKKFKGIFTYGHTYYRRDIIQNTPTNEVDTIQAHIGIFEGVLKFKKRKALRWEMQHLATEQDRGNWALLLLEYTMNSKWYFSVLDEYNYGNKEEKLRIHYYNFSITHINKATRISLSYGKQRDGIFCVGGVCRNIPAYNGFSLSVSSSF